MYPHSCRPPQYRAEQFDVALYRAGPHLASQALSTVASGSWYAAGASPNGVGCDSQSAHAARLSSGAPFRHCRSLLAAERYTGRNVRNTNACIRLGKRRAVTNRRTDTLGARPRPTV